MALKVKGAAESAKKLVERAQSAAGEYSIAAQAAGDAWQTGAVGAKDTYGMAISAAGIKDRFARGVAKAGAAKFVRKVKDVGADRFSSGVAAGQADYAANVEPYLSTVAGLTLSARGPRGSASNFKRVQEVGQALNAKRMAMLGSS